MSHVAERKVSIRDPPATSRVPMGKQAPPREQLAFLMILVVSVSADPRGFPRWTGQTLRLVQTVGATEARSWSKKPLFLDAPIQTAAAGHPARFPLPHPAPSSPHIPLAGRSPWLTNSKRQMNWLPRPGTRRSELGASLGEKLAQFFSL